VFRMLTDSSTQEATRHAQRDYPLAKATGYGIVRSVGSTLPSSRIECGEQDLNVGLRLCQKISQRCIVVGVKCIGGRRQVGSQLRIPLATFSRRFLKFCEDALAAFPRSSVPLHYQVPVPPSAPHACEIAFVIRHNLYLRPPNDTGVQRRTREGA
jgi:hypothetical protein